MVWGRGATADRVAAAAAEILHVGFNLPLRQAFSVASVFVMIQIAMYVPMFWIRRRFIQTRNPRLAITLVGSYCLLMGIAAFRYGTELKLIDVQKSEYVTFSIFVIVAILNPVGCQSEMAGERIGESRSIH